jgi:hypothetical protein
MIRKSAIVNMMIKSEILACSWFYLDYVYIMLRRRRDSSVCIASGYGLDGLGSILDRGRIFSFP